MDFVSTRNAPTPAGHYSQAVIHNDLVFVSGQLPVNPETMPDGRQASEKVVSSIEEQTLLALNNLKTILEAAGSSINKVLKVTVYISDISLWGRVNAVYSEFFKDHMPARAVVPTKELHFGFQIEIEAIATIK